ncbi:MAG: leucine-rich repeat protein [Oscillospiraceae bacterium]|nr:leucine-rich repeat protein [Oscillospiraceae bacterium]
MKKTMKTAIALMSAVMMLGTCAVPAFAGELSKEELIQKYAPNGAYAEADIYICPGEFPTVMSDGSLLLQHDYVQKLEASGLSVEEQLEKLTEAFSNSTGSKVSAYNNYRRGSYADCVQYFVNAEYENGFWYVLREDGTASIVGADQAWVEENSPAALHIPAEIGGVTVTKIEDGAFAFETRYNHGIKEITVPDTVEIIGDSAFNTAMLGMDCRLNLPQNVRYIGRLAFNATMHMLMDEFNVITIPESVEFIGAEAFGDNKYRALIHDRLSEYLTRNYHFRFFNQSPNEGDSFRSCCLFDMPESPVFIESDMIGISECVWGDVSYYERVTTLDPFFFLPNARTGCISCDINDSGCRYITVGEYPENPEQVLETMLNLAPEYGTAEELENEFQRLDRLYQKVRDFMAAYDTEKMPTDHVAYFMGGQALYNQYDVVTLGDVTEYYNKLAAKPAPVVSVCLAGDADCSGTVDVSDAVLTARFVAEDAGAKITDAGLQNADADGDGAVTMDDITAIQRIIAKL